VGDAPPAVLFSERKHCLLHFLWGLAGRALGTAGSIHQACLPFGETVFHPLADGVVGAGKPSGGLPGATVLFRERLERRKIRPRGQVTMCWPIYFADLTTQPKGRYNVNANVCCQQMGSGRGCRDM